MWRPQEPQPLVEFSRRTMVPFGRVDEWCFRQGHSKHRFFFCWKAVEFEVWGKKQNKTRLPGLSSSHCEDKSLMTQVRCILLFLESRHFDTEAASVSAFCRFASNVVKSDWRTGRATFRCWQTVISQACAQHAAYSHINFSMCQSWQT